MMLTPTDSDIHRGYIRFIQLISSKRGKTKRDIIRLLPSYVLYQLFTLFKVCFIPILYAYGIFLILFLKTKLFWANHHNESELHKNAIKNIPEFISQYPMHLYPVIAKSMEIAFIKKKLREVTPRIKGEIAELAIGEGTFSNRIFSVNDALFGFDLNPYSLIHTRKYPQVKKKVVADCRNPPIAPCGVSMIVCNNFLHHVTEKEKTIQNWALMAPYALFNENTNYWASGWSKPYALKLVGLENAAQQAAKRIELHSLQALWKKEQLTSLIDRFYEIEEEQSFLHEEVFFLSAVCSALLFCYGPPTPDLQKRIMNRMLGPITRILTYHMAKALIEYDAFLSRDKDTYICWLGKSKLIGSDCLPNRISLVCPDCRGSIQENTCTNCHITFEEKEGMLFLLPKELRTEISYLPSGCTTLGEEHL